MRGLTRRRGERGPLARLRRFTFGGFVYTGTREDEFSNATDESLANQVCRALNFDRGRRRREEETEGV